jgi:hypothetical protein
MFIFVCVIFRNSSIVSLFTFFGLMPRPFYSFYVNNPMSLTLLPYISSTLPLAFPHMPSIVYLGATYIPSKGTRLTFFQSIFPVTGSLCSPYPDYPRGRAH